MLLRSSSTPILKSWLHQPKDSSPEPDFQVLQRTKSISLTTSLHSQLPIEDPTKKITTHAVQESRLQKPKKSTLKIPHHTNKQDSKIDNNDQEEEEVAKPTSSRIQRLFSSSGLGERVVNEDEKESSGVQTLVMGGGVGDGASGGISGGDGGGRGSGDRDGDGGSDFYGSDSIDGYYQKMIEANPDNALLLGNYAKFLKEVLRNSSFACNSL